MQCHSKTSKMTNFGTCHLQKIIIFKLLLKPSFARSFGHLGIFARSNSLSANSHLARFITFEVVICEVLLYNVGIYWFLLLINLVRIVHQIFNHGSNIIYVPIEMIIETLIYCNQHVTCFRRLLVCT